ncbi:MAG: hypothetical protein MJ211_04550 [Bacteroidales bacterium]|nr:hypothetical protein [Bacteroidales bacterium]
MKKVFILLVLVVCSNSLFSQEDNVNDYNVNYSLYKSLLDVEAYNYAREPFKIIFSKYPEKSKNVYLDGVKLYKGFISKTSNTDTINAYVDTLKTIYFQRMQYFGDSANVLGRCGIDIMKLRKSDSAYFEAYNLLNQSIKLYNFNPDLSIASTYIQLATSLVIAKQISYEDYYNNAIKTLMNISKESFNQDQKYSENVSTIIQSVNKKTQKLDKTELAKLFDNNIEVNDNENENKAIYNVLECLNCDNCETYAKVSEKMYALNPTAQAASAIAKYFKNNKNFDKAAEYYKEAIDKETENIQKSEHYYNLATVNCSRKQYQSAISQLKKSIELNSENGKSFILISTIYGNVATSNIADEFERSKIYWVAADYAAKAKRVDNTLKDEAEKLINTFAHKFTTSSEAFMHSVKGGDSVPVTIWGFDEVTTARF